MNVDTFDLITMQPSDNASLSLLTVENNFTSSIQDDCQKQRKLTVDSGYGDDMSDMKESEPSFTRTSSLDSISEDAFHNRNSMDTENEIDIDTENVVQSKVKEKRRRMTPVPGAVHVIKPSQNTPCVVHERSKILFVEEEDNDDIEKYNYEDDFICHAVQSRSSRLTTKRNSWHGITEVEKFGKFHKAVALTKSKSLDRGFDYPRRRKRSTDMSVPSISLEELSLECKRPMFKKQNSLKEGMTSMENNSFRQKLDTISKCPVTSNESRDDVNNTSNLPAWMRTAAQQQQQHSSSSSSSSSSSCSDEVENENKDDNNEMFNKLQIPQINWEKINADKNKANKLLSEQRKALTKEKNKASSRRRRKLTPSESPSHSSLEKLLTLRSASLDWSVTEEEDEEEEES